MISRRRARWTLPARPGPERLAPQAPRSPPVRKPPACARASRSGGRCRVIELVPICPIIKQEMAGDFDRTCLRHMLEPGGGKQAERAHIKCRTCEDCADDEPQAGEHCS